MHHTPQTDLLTTEANWIRHM